MATKEGDYMKVHLVMGNDFPAAVFSTEELAAAYCERRRGEELPGMRRIHWRHYEFELDRDREK